MAGDNNKSRNMGWVFMLIKHPYIALVIAIIAIVAIIAIASLGALIATSSSSSGSDSAMPVTCQTGELDTDLFNQQFNGKGAFDGMGDAFLTAAEKYGIDPVILASIAMHETGYGTSKMVQERNNPGGLYNSSTSSFFVYDSLEEGIDAMASNLNRLYFSQGLFTVEQIGAKYAPIGVANDPNNLNAHWVPNVTAVVQTFGGYSMNCEAVGGTGGMGYPVKNPQITSDFGMRIHPITGQPEGHKGIDFQCSTGDPIYAAFQGKIYASNFNNGGYGHHIVIQTGNNYTLYAHMSARYVNTGDTVNAGDMIGACGSTGDSTGSHLHFELQLGAPYANHVDPKPYLGGETIE
ncbi:M23 family metallopeptidase [Terribacillus saccharophilus]|uniref:M23 family metallopeptidase n=1 Tax=Terribacillus saccharophilus TaxID=361277 RepID=UPI002989B4F9|nr:M23 family metallopeptidase [Terribacillus saccharophilus]MCM3227559.1 M23 family metallopeptidase [Terribacillus saccharophilus]